MMIVCLLDGVIKRPIGYSGGRRPGRQADRRPRADEASRFLAFISHTSINFHWRTTRNRESNGDHLARSCSVVSWHHQGYSRAAARIDVHLETSPAIRLDATYRGAGQQYCMSMGWEGTDRMQQALRGRRHHVQRGVHVLGVLAHVQHDALAQRRRAHARPLAQHALQLQRVFAVAVRG